jgi:hypothetical protein
MYRPQNRPNGFLSYSKGSPLVAADILSSKDLSGQFLKMFRTTVDNFIKLHPTHRFKEPLYFELRARAAAAVGYNRARKVKP